MIVPYKPEIPRKWKSWFDIVPFHSNYRVYAVEKPAVSQDYKLGMYNCYIKHN